MLLAHMVRAFLIVDVAAGSACQQGQRVSPLQRRCMKPSPLLSIINRVSACVLLAGCQKHRKWKTWRQPSKRRRKTNGEKTSRCAPLHATSLLAICPKTRTTLCGAARRAGDAVGCLCLDKTSAKKGWRINSLPL